MLRNLTILIDSTWTLAVRDIKVVQTALNPAGLIRDEPPLPRRISPDWFSTLRGLGALNDGNQSDFVNLYKNQTQPKYVFGDGTASTEPPNTT
jgi:hypothetical protein